VKPGSPPAWALRRHWGLDPGVVFLNHGSFGACPLAVLEEQSKLRAEMEAEPIRFLVRELEDRLDVARAALGGFIGASPDDLAFVTNATSGVNAVLRWLPLDEGDELLTTDHAYNACKNALDVVAERARARVVVARVPFPLASPDEAAEAILAAATPRTRLALIDHVTSPTGLVFPVERLVPELQRKGALVLVDGAHAPGMLPLDLDALGADFYTGNCHKWLCAPKGAAFLHVRRDRQSIVRPLVISHGANSPRTDRTRFRIESDWVGTNDPTPWLCIPSALDVVGRLVPGGWPEVMSRNRALALDGRGLLCEALEIPSPAPAGMIGSLAAVPLPDGTGDLVPPLFVDPLQDALWERGIEVPSMPWPAWPKRLLRIAPHLYTDRSELERLAEDIRELV
jgi:isopenicillin-N epimerase